jgi:hypothetical protein
MAYNFNPRLNKTREIHAERYFGSDNRSIPVGHVK